MKKFFRLPVFSILASSFLFISCNNNPAPAFDRENFKNPPVTAQVHTWWHWLDGAITREGITRDLESMKAQGISQATILNIGLFGDKDLGVSKIVFNTSEWYEMFHWALQEADRLGIKIGAHNCDGWSSSGGPWITPENSMKQFTWSKTFITGGQSVQVGLSRPPAVLDFYHDVAVVAYKSEDLPSSFQQEIKHILCNGKEVPELKDGNPLSNLQLKKGDRYRFEFNEPFTAEKISLMLRKTFAWGNLDYTHCIFTLNNSDNGKTFRKIKSFEMKGVNEMISIEIPSTTGKYFELMVEEPVDVDNSFPYTLAECELLKATEHALYNPSVLGLSAKSVFVKTENMDVFNPAVSENENRMKHPEVIDLTSKLSPEGVLNWDAPSGNWMVIRFGYTTTGATNGPATAEGRGLECDKMDTAALNLHFNSFPKKLVETAGKFTGNTFKFLLIDSWECGFQNWTGDFMTAFKKHKGYDILPWIPLLCGENIDNAENSEAFLYDFRSTIAELIDRNYYRHFRDLCHENFLEMHAEAIYGGPGYPPLDILKANSYPDLNMWEFWAGHNYNTSFTEYTPSSEPNSDFPALSSALYGKSVLGAESYTAQAHFSESPWDLKPFGDRAFCSGVNQFILHSYVHQPTDRKPGMTLLRWGSHFNRNNLYWNMASDWLKYHARVQSVLQQGTTQADILAYVGDQLPSASWTTKAYPLPWGYEYAACNQDILKKLKVVNGKLRLPSGPEYTLLTLPRNNQMDLQTIKIIARLVKEGAVLYGPKPVDVLSLKNHEKDKEELQALAAELWGDTKENVPLSRKVGQGSVFWEQNIAEVLKQIRAVPDFYTQPQDSLNFMYIHKSLPAGDVYFVFNQQDQPLDRECHFRVNKCTPEIWDAETGDITEAGLYSMEGAQLCLPVHFAARQSRLFVFPRGVEKDHYTNLVKEGIQLFPSIEGEVKNEIPTVSIKDGKLLVQAAKKGNYKFTTNAGSTIVVDAPGTQSVIISGMAGTLEFEASYDAGIQKQQVTKLASWTSSSDADMKYFSGTGTYKLRFEAPEGFVDCSDSLYLTLGEVGVIAKVKLNGKDLGIAWKPNKEFNVTGILQAQNQLEVEVSNVYRNRMIGDYVQYGKIQTVWTPAPVEEYLDKNKPLKPSGLMGPVVVSRVSYNK